MMLCLVIGVLSVYSMVALATSDVASPSGRLAVFGKKVTVNGISADCGAPIFSNSTIITAADSSATVSLGTLGVIELMPNSSMRLSFNESQVEGTLDTGYARVSTPAGISAIITTKDGTAIAKSDEANIFSVAISCGTTIVGTETGNIELRTAGATKHIASGSQDVAGQSAPGTRCAMVKVREIKTMYPRCSRGMR